MTVAAQNPCMNLLSPGLNVGLRIPLFSYRNSGCILKRPSALKAIAQNGAAHADAPGALRNGYGFVLPLNWDIFPGIAVLSGPCCPAAIFRRVTLVIVDSIKGVSLSGVLAHVFQKVGELYPSITNRDPATSIMQVGWSSGVQTPTFHIRPGSIGAALFLFHRNIFRLRAQVEQEERNG